MMSTSYTPTSPLLAAPPDEPLRSAVVRYCALCCASPYFDVSGSRAVVEACAQMAALVGLDPVLMLAVLVHESDYLRDAVAAPPQRNPLALRSRHAVPLHFDTYATGSFPAAFGVILWLALPTSQEPTALQRDWMEHPVVAGIAQCPDTRPTLPGTLVDLASAWHASSVNLAALATRLVSHALAAYPHGDHDA